MEEFTRKFNVAQEKDAEIRHILTTVYAALEDKGYNPINQIVGYILSEDPTWIATSCCKRLCAATSASKRKASE